MASQRSLKPLCLRLWPRCLSLMPLRRGLIDEAERLVRLDRDGTFLAAGVAPARDCLSVLGAVPPLSAAGSLAEFIRGLAGAPLTAGATVRHEGLLFTVLDTDAAGMPLRVRIATGRRPAGG